MTGARLWAVIKDAVQGFIADECLSRGASIAYFTLFSLSPLLVVAIAIAGAVFGEAAVQGAVAEQLRGLLGEGAAEAVQQAIVSASNVGEGVMASALGIGLLLLTASGTFGEIQASLNAIWKTQVPQEGTVSRLLKAKAAAIGLVAATGFLLLTSLVASAAIAVIGTWLADRLPGGKLLLEAANSAISLLLLSALFAAIYKVLPDRTIAWRDVAVGAVTTALLFTLGKSLIGLYIGQAGIAGSFGAAGSLAVILVWTYYSSLIFLFGAEITRAWANREGSRRAKPVPAEEKPEAPPAAPAPAPVVVAVPVSGVPAGTLAGVLALVLGIRFLQRPRG